MKLKVAILASSLILSINIFANGLEWQYWRIGTGFNYTQYYTDTKENAINEAQIYFALNLRPLPIINDPQLDKTRFLENIRTNENINFSIVTTYPTHPIIAVSNIVTSETINYDDLFMAESSSFQLITQVIKEARSFKGGYSSLFDERSIIDVKFSSPFFHSIIINVPVFVDNLLKVENIYQNQVISDNIKAILTILSENKFTINSIEFNQLQQNEALQSSLKLQSSITNLLYGISINSTYANEKLETIKTVAQTFAQDQRIKQLASGQIFSTLNPSTTGGSGGVIYEALDQLVRLNMLKQGVNITESELNTMSTSDKWTKSGMAVKYGSYSDNYDNRNIGIIVGTEAIKENENFQNKVNTLSQLADDNGNVIDPLTGELTKLTNAIKDWDKGKVDGALASYQYNNPAATNGFFGEIKRTLTEEGDWRLLDKGIKEKQESFMDNITQDGVKINTKQGPIAVTVNNDDGLIVNFPDEVFQSKIFKTSNSTLDIWYDKWIDWKILWSNFTGVENHNDRGFLDIMLERNDLYYSYVTNKMYGTVSNQLARLIELNEHTNRLNFVNVPRATYVRYLMRGIGTTDNNDDDLFAIKDEPTFAFDGSTNFEQAVAFQLHDLFEVSQNGSKADMMTADFIRGIYQLLGTGSNIAVQVAYITNTVYKANGLSTDKNDYSSYEQEKEKLDADFTEFNDILEEMQEKTVEKINFVSYRVFADYTLPTSLTLLEFNNQKFEIDLNKWDKIFIMMHNCAQLAWLAVGLLMLPRVAYMLICFGLKMLGKFYGILTSK